MSLIREKRIEAGLSATEMCELFGIPKRTLENYELSYSKPPVWAEKLLIEKLENIAKQKKKDRGM